MQKFSNISFIGKILFAKGIKMDYLLGIDIATSGTKGVLMDREGKIYARAGREYSIDIPQPGWAEQNPKMWCEATILFSNLKMSLKQVPDR